jgi:hypothetical protein
LRVLDFQIIIGIRINNHPVESYSAGVFVAIFECPIFFLTFGRNKGKTDYAEIKSPTETTSEAFPSADTGYQAVGIAKFTVGTAD